MAQRLGRPLIHEYGARQPHRTGQRQPLRVGAYHGRQLLQREVDSTQKHYWREEQGEVKGEESIIDLAVCPGIPRLEDVLQAVLSELQVQASRRSQIRPPTKGQSRARVS